MMMILDILYSNIRLSHISSDLGDCRISNLSHSESAKDLPARAEIS